jgi:hypothetical protein
METTFAQKKDQSEREERPVSRASEVRPRQQCILARRTYVTIVTMAAERHLAGRPAGTKAAIGPPGIAGGPAAITPP